jgi:hypothetical protein
VDAWEVVIALSGAGSAAIAAWAAYQSRASAREANRAATALAEIERDRRNSELTPLLLVSCEILGGDWMVLRVTLTGPPGLHHIDSITATIRDDDILRNDRHLPVQGLTREEVKAQIWGSYRFQPRAGPTADALADSTGRTIDYKRPVPVGESLTFPLEANPPPPWMNFLLEGWRDYVGTILRLSFAITHEQYGAWMLRASWTLAASKIPVASSTKNLGPRCGCQRDSRPATARTATSRAIRGRGSSPCAGLLS